MFKKIWETAMSVGTAACMGYIVGIPVTACVGMTTIGGTIGALALLTNPAIIAVSMLVGAVNFTGFLCTNCAIPEMVWIIP